MPLIRRVNHGAAVISDSGRIPLNPVLCWRRTQGRALVSEFPKVWDGAGGQPRWFLLPAVSAQVQELPFPPLLCTSTEGVFSHDFAETPTPDPQPPVLAEPSYRLGHLQTSTKQGVGSRPSLRLELTDPEEAEVNLQMLSGLGKTPFTPQRPSRRLCYFAQVEGAGPLALASASSPSLSSPHL